MLNFKRKAVWVSAAVMIVAAATSMAGFGKSSNGDLQMPATAVATTEDIQQVVRAAGVVQPQKKVDVGAQVSGQVRTLFVKLGQEVKVGDRLVSLDADLAASDVVQGEAALEQQRAAVHVRSLELSAAQTELDRQTKLNEVGMTPRQDFDRAKQAVERIQADLEGVRASERRIKADLDRRRLSLRYTEIRSPINGQVVNLPIQEGQTVLSMQFAPLLMTLADLSKVTVKAKVPEADISAVRVGNRAKFTAMGVQKSYEGQVSSVQPMPEKVGGALYYVVSIDVDNEDRALLSEMTVSVQIEVSEAKGVLAVPVAALGAKTIDGMYELDVVEEHGKIAQKQVRVGVTNGAKVQVLDGIKAGDKVVIERTAAKKLGKGKPGSEA